MKKDLVGGMTTFWKILGNPRNENMVNYTEQKILFSLIEWYR